MHVVEKVVRQNLMISDWENCRLLSCQWTQSYFSCVLEINASCVHLFLVFNAILMWHAVPKQSWWRLILSFLILLLHNLCFVLEYHNEFPPKKVWDFLIRMTSVLRNYRIITASIKNNLESLATVWIEVSIQVNFFIFIDAKQFSRVPMNTNFHAFLKRIKTSIFLVFGQP